MWPNKLFLILGCILCGHPVFSLWSCTDNSDCSTTEGAFCLAGDCVCPSGQQLVLGGSLCAESAPYYTSSCLEDHQCSNLVTNFECRRFNDTREGNCLCQPGFHYFRGRCWRSVDHGESCNRNEECMGVLRNPFNMACVGGACDCAEGYYERQRGECRKIGFAVGDGCVLDEDCQFNNGVCDLTSFRCIDSTTEATLADTVRNNITTRSLTRQHGIECDVANPCASPFLCSAFGSCVCPNGYYANDAGTLCLAELGSPATDEQCVGFMAEIVDGVCACPSNIFFDENMRDCVKATRRLTDSCVSDQMCHTFGPAARCTEPQTWFLRNCECIPELAVWDEARSMCRLFVGIGESCQANSDCLAGGMEIECVENSEGQGVCACPAGFVAVDGLCLTSGLELGDSCQATQECTGTAHAVCEAARCSCGEGYQEVDDHCAPTIGGTCVINNDCAIENSICVAGNTTSTCQCAENFVEYNDICWRALATITSQCEVSAQCAALMGEASYCIEGQCECDERYHSRDEGCWPRIGLFETCSRNSECFLNDISDRVVCRNSLCQCSFDYPYSEQLHTCTSSATATVSSIFTIIVTLFYVLS